MTEQEPYLDAPAKPEPWHAHTAPPPDEAPAADEPAPLGLVLLWCVWLLGSWAMTLLTDASVEPAVRLMMFAAALGMLLLWPALRLSQGPRRDGGRAARWSICRQVFWDWTCLSLVLQVVIWPLYFSASWGLSQAIWLDLVLLSWSLLTGLLIAVGLTLGDGAARMLAMLACVLLVFGEPLVVSLLGWDIGALRISPLQVLWDATGSHVHWSEAKWISVVLAVTAAAIVGWCLLPLLGRGRREQI